jgi:predicted dienelactone hydrolase
MINSRRIGILGHSYGGNTMLFHGALDERISFAPRHLLLVSATEDEFSQDADRIVAIAREKCATAGIPSHIEHIRYEGGHALNQERFDSIVNWIAGHAG